MDVVQFLIVCVIAGAALYLLGLAPIDATIKRVIQVIVVVALIIMAIRLLLPMAGLS
jgi:hypothetical protein